MTVLVTGATGYVGRRVAQRLVARGETVIGSIRSQERRSDLPQGVLPLIADIRDADRLVSGIAEVDHVIHTAFTGHGGDFAEAVDTDARLIKALCEALRDTGKTLIVSNGTVFLGDTSGARASEETPVVADHPASPRATATAQARAAGSGFRGIEIRLASFVYGYGGSVFLPVMADAARRAGFAFWVGEGTNATSTVHVDKAADAYIDAMDRGAGGEVYHIAGEEEPTVRQIAEALGAGLDLKAKSVTQEQAAALTDPFTAYFLTVDNRLDATKARWDLGWSHAGAVPMLHDLAMGSYAINCRDAVA